MTADLVSDAPEPSEADTRAALPPRRDERTCGHGVLIGDNSDIAGMAFAAPFMHCICCERDRPYIDSAMMTMSTDGTSTYVGTHTDQHLCSDCGGRIRRIIDPPDALQPRDPATFPVGMRGPISERRTT